MVLTLGGPTLLRQGRWSLHTTPVAADHNGAMTQFESRPTIGRVFTITETVRLADTGPDGFLRPDGVARMLQDAATDDWVASGLGDTATWVVRQTSVAVVGRRPGLNDTVTLETFCAGIGAAWAERRTDLLVDGDVVIQATALWVPIDTSSGRPQRVRPDFKEVYGEAAQGRKVSGRLEAPGAPSSGALRQPWQLRAVDLDVVGHVNNAALWAPLVEVAGSDLAAVTVIHHGPVEAGDEVMLAVDGHRLWLEADGVVAVTANWDESA